MNREHSDELRRLAKQKNDADGVDWSVEKMESVRLMAVDDEAMHLEEVLCSVQDQRCMAVEIPVPWPAGAFANTALPTSGDGDVSAWRRAFTEISRKAYAAIYDDAIPPEYEAQQQALNGLMRHMNAEFSHLLKYYALRHARAAFSLTEQLERAKLTQLTFEGLSLEIETLELMEEEVFFGGMATNRSPRKFWSVSLLFDQPCAGAEQVEDMLVNMFERDEPPREAAFVPVPQAARSPSAQPLPATLPGPAGGPSGDGEGLSGEATRDPLPSYNDPSDPMGKHQAIQKAESFAEYQARGGGGAYGATAMAAPAAHTPDPPAAGTPLAAAFEYV